MDAGKEKICSVRPLVTFNLQHVVKEILDVDCPEGATFSERSLWKSIDSYQLSLVQKTPEIFYNDQ